MNTNSRRQALVKILQAAHSGELAAGLAYRGHWKSLASPDEREHVRRIEAEEWNHRQRVGEILNALEASPRKSKEIIAWCIGRAAGFGCHVTGWLMPMYLAGRLETQNVAEYEHAVKHATALGLQEFANDLEAMAVTEAAHESFFVQMVATHRLTPLVQLVFPWPSADPHRNLAIQASERRVVDSTTILLSNSD